MAGRGELSERLPVSARTPTDSDLGGAGDAHREPHDGKHPERRERDSDRDRGLKRALRDSESKNGDADGSDDTRTQSTHGFRVSRIRSNHGVGDG